MPETQGATRRRLLLSLLLPLLSLGGVAAADARQSAGSGPHFGAGNIPAGCEADLQKELADGSDNPRYWLAPESQAVCHHIRTGLNGLDSPQVDVLVLVPVSPAAERDARVIRQSIEMWEGGTEHVARRLGLDWLAEGMDFHVTVDHVDVTGEDGGEFTTYPVTDPEIVVVATNPVGGLGIGIDPVDFFGVAGGQGPCHGISPAMFELDTWQSLPGFDSHHEEREGIYNEDCGGAGGNVCFAVNGAIDPTPGEGATEDVFALFDLVSHEVGHCLTVGHVGDGAEGDWGGLPTNDIMAYHADPPGLSKCVSSLDVEGLATVMSRYLDVNGDGQVTPADELQANDQEGEGGSPFQVQRPEDHFYASSTGSATDCPQPDLALLPGGPRTDWTPDEAPAKGKGKGKG